MMGDLQRESPRTAILYHVSSRLFREMHLESLAWLSKLDLSLIGVVEQQPGTNRPETLSESGQGRYACDRYQVFDYTLLSRELSPVHVNAVYELASAYPHFIPM